MPNPDDVFSAGFVSAATAEPSRRMPAPASEVPLIRSHQREVI